jgi:hypothetical protein
MTQLARLVDPESSCRFQHTECITLMAVDDSETQVVSGGLRTWERGKGERRVAD